MLLVKEMYLGNMNRNKAMLVNGTTSLVQQLVILICGLIVPRLVLKTFGSSANGMVSSVSQFISITSLIQGGITGASRVAFYAPVARRDWNSASVVYKTSQEFFHRFAAILSVYVFGLAIFYPIFVEIPFNRTDAFILILILGIQSVAEYLFGITNQLLLFADQKAYINTTLHIICTVFNAVVAVCLINSGASLIVVKFGSAMVFLIRPVILAWIVKKNYPLDKSVKKDSSVLSQSKAALAKSIAFYVHSSTDTIVITACLNVMWVSVYAVHRYVVGNVSNLVANVLGNTEALFGQMIARNETEQMKRDIPLYDLMSKMLSSIFFFTSYILITPFIRIYTHGVTDIDYYQPVFALLLCAAEFVYCTSLTYNNVIMGAGHIKQTQWISIVEALINIGCSLVFVKTLGVIGVALGTLLAFVFNTMANIIYMRKYIFDMSVKWIVKTYVVNIVAGVALSLIIRNFCDHYISGYVSFFVVAAITFALVIATIVGANFLFFGNETKFVLKKIAKRFI